ncbi:MAG: hypothetical protein V2G42_02260 [bacterium JZ-2024 1]
MSPPRLPVPPLRHDFTGHTRRDRAISRPFCPALIQQARTKILFVLRKPAGSKVPSAPPDIILLFEDSPGHVFEDRHPVPALNRAFYLQKTRKRPARRHHPGDALKSDIVR